MKNGNISNRAVASTICFRAEDLMFPHKTFNQFSRKNMDKNVLRVYMKLLKETDLGVSLAVSYPNVPKVEKLGLFDMNAALYYSSRADILTALERKEVTCFVCDDTFARDLWHRRVLTFDALVEQLRAM